MRPKRKVAVSGAGGFIGSHLLEWGRREEDVVLIGIDRELYGSDELSVFLGECDTLVHLAGMNRGEEHEIYETNVRLAEQLVDGLNETDVKPHVVYISTIQRELSTAYGKSKREAEIIFHEWAESTGGALSILIVPNVFGAGCRPFYNSVVATFCHQLLHGEEPRVFEDRELELLEVKGLVEEIAGAIENLPEGVDFLHVEGTGRITTTGLLHLLADFKKRCVDQVIAPEFSDPLRSALYQTFLSYVGEK